MLDKIPKEKKQYTISYISKQSGIFVVIHVS
jgi:hypothetical protein